MRTMMSKRSYHVLYADGSEDEVEGYDIGDAKSTAEMNYEQPVKKLTVISDPSQCDDCHAPTRD